MFNMYIIYNWLIDFFDCCISAYTISELKRGMFANTHYHVNRFFTAKVSCKLLIFNLFLFLVLFLERKLINESKKDAMRLSLRWVDG